MDWSKLTDAEKVYVSNQVDGLRGIVRKKSSVVMTKYLAMTNEEIKAEILKAKQDRLTAIATQIASLNSEKTTLEE